MPALLASEDAYSYRLDPSVLSLAKMGPNATLYFNREVPVLLRADQSVDPISVSSATAGILMLGKYHSPSVSVDLELHGALQNGALEIPFPMGRLDAALFEWEELGAHPKELDGLGARLQSLTFRDNTGFRAVYSLKRKTEYQLTVDVPYKSDTQSLGEPDPSFRAAADFIRLLEKDARCRVILESNQTGLPVFVSAGDKPGSLAAGFLADTIRRDAEDRREYAYTAPLSRVAGLPEVKRVLRDAAVKSFIAGAEDVLVKGIGSDEAGFQFTISKEGGKRLEATLTGKKVVVKS